MKLLKLGLILVIAIIIILADIITDLKTVASPVVADDPFIKPVVLRCDYLENPVGIDIKESQLSWQIPPEDLKRNWKQETYRILVASRPELLGKEHDDLWDNGKVDSEQSVHMVYGSKELPSYDDGYWKVRVWREGDSKPSAWSKVVYWTIGIQKSSEWKGLWIGYDKPIEDYVLVPYITSKLLVKVKILCQMRADL